MAVTIEYHNLGKLPNQGLGILQCGRTVCSAGHSQNFVTYLHNSMTFIISGKGSYTVAGKTYTLNKGEGFLIPPKVSVSYTADRQEPWTYYYVIFGGNDAKTLMQSAGLSASHPVFSFPDFVETERGLKKMFEASKSLSALGVDVLGQFLLVVSELIRTAEHPLENNNNAQEYLARATSFIADHYPYNITVADIAEYVMIDRTYLFKLFRNHYGMSPLQYLRDYRLARAAALMEKDKLTMGEIAASAGFYDISHFYRAFGEKYGVTPGQFRENLRKEN